MILNVCSRTVWNSQRINSTRIFACEWLVIDQHRLEEIIKNKNRLSVCDRGFAPELEASWEREGLEKYMKFAAKIDRLLKLGARARS